MSELKAEGRSPLNKIKWVLVVGIIVAALYAYQRYSADVAAFYRVSGFMVALFVAAGVALTTQEGKWFNQFRKDAWIELRRVIWPTRQETMQTTLIVVIFVTIVSLLLYFFDSLVGWLFRLIGIVG